MDQFYQVLVEKCPFMTYGTYADQDFVGIVQNCDNSIVSMYVYNIIPDQGMRKLFLAMGQSWWEESNRQLPINVFLRGQFKIFNPYMKTLIKKEFNHVCGPMTSLQDVMKSRVKRRQINIDMLKKK